MSCSSSSASTSRTSPSSTSGCRRRIRPRASTPPARSATRAPETAILVLSAHVDVEHAMDLLASGERSGYLLKSRVTDVDEFLDTLDRILKGGSAVDPALVQELVAARRVHDPLADLSPREREVLELMAEGRSNAGIAASSLGHRGHRREARAQHPRQAAAARDRRGSSACPRGGRVPRVPLGGSPRAGGSRSADSSDFGTNPATGASSIRSAKSLSACVEIRITLSVAPYASTSRRATSRPLSGPEQDVHQRDVRLQLPRPLERLVHVRGEAGDHEPLTPEKRGSLLEEGRRCRRRSGSGVASITQRGTRRRIPHCS